MKMKQTGRGFRWTALFGVLGMVAMTAISVPANADHTVSLSGSNFEIDSDANLVVTHSTPAIDWATVTETRKKDLDSGSLDDSFGQGSKEDTEVPEVVDGSIPPNKSDLLNFGVYLEDTAGGDFLHLFWHRVQEPSGTTNMDFEFNKSKTLSSNGVTPVRSAGDLLIQYDLSQGGVNPLLFVSKWVASGHKSQCEAANATPCWGTKENFSAANKATGTINTSAIPAAQSDGLGDVSSRTFGEASLDFDALGGGDGCNSFGSAYLKSRSSDSFTAALKDFIAPTPLNLDQCGPLKIVKRAGSTTGGVLAGAKFKVYKDDGDGVDELGTEDVQIGKDGQPSTAAAAECTTTSDGTGDCNYVDLLIGEKYWVHETQAPAGFVIVEPNPVLVTITSTSLHTVTFVNTPALGNLTVTKRDDGGNLMNGIKFTLVGTSTSGQSVSLNCITGTSNSSGTAVPSAGTCSFLDVPIGTYTLDEDASNLPAGYTKDPTFSKQVTITNGGSLQVSATNPRTHRVVVLVCHEGTDTLFTKDVVNGSSTKASIGEVPKALFDKGVTQKELCDLGGASFGNLGHDDKALTAKITNAGH